MAEKKELREEITEEIRRFWGEAIKGLKKLGEEAVELSNKSLKRLGEEAVELSKRSEGKIIEASRKLGKEATEIARRGEEKLVSVSRMGKLSLDLLSLKRKKEEKLKEIGDKVYAAGPEKVDQASLKELCREIKKIESEIEEKEKEIKALKKIVKGPSGSSKPESR